MIDKARIIELMPHGESMCLINQVVSWDDTAIRCQTFSHTDKHNPLSALALLPTITLVEYGAQAAAIHGALLSNNALGEARNHKPAFLGTVKSLEVFADVVPNIDSPLDIIAMNEMFSTSGAIYDFTVSLGDDVLAKARLSLLVPA